MSKCFRQYQPEQTLLLPPSLDDWLPEGHLTRFLSEVMGELDLGRNCQSYEEGRPRASGVRAADDVKVLFYGYGMGSRTPQPSRRRSAPIPVITVPRRCGRRTSAASTSM